MGHSWAIFIQLIMHIKLHGNFVETSEAESKEYFLNDLIIIMITFDEYKRAVNSIF